jgi:cytochrome c peroxidase
MAGLRFFSLLVVCALVGACSSAPRGDDPKTADAGDSDSIFTDLELAVIRAQFGRLPLTPPSDPTDLTYADNVDASLLGEKFFFEKSYSPNGQISCATCHQPENAFQDKRLVNGAIAPTSQGLMFTGRHAPSLLNSGYGAVRANTTDWQFWDGRKDSLWSQALAPPENPSEMGGSRTQVALMIFDKYQSEYVGVFKSMPQLRAEIADADALATPSADPTSAAYLAWTNDLTDQARLDVNTVYSNFGKAIAAYERRLVDRDSLFDQFREDLIKDASSTPDELNSPQVTGLKLFIGRAHCVSCHFGPNLTDGLFHNLGVPQVGDHVLASDDGRQGGIPKLQADTDFNCQGTFSEVADKTQCAVASLEPQASDLGAFKTPSLRGVTARGPYFHTGFAKTLDDVVTFYDGGGGRANAEAGVNFVGSVDATIVPLGLTPDERDALVAFLGTLTGTTKLPAELTTPPLPP